MSDVRIAGFSPAALGVLSCWLTFATARAGEPPEPSRDELIRHARAATVVIELESGGPHATGFCVDPSGLFVTAGHAVIHPRSRTLVERPNVIVKPGEAGREVLPAKLVCRLEEPDLAFVRVEGAKRPFDALPFGTEASLEELMDVLAFGVPFPRASDFPAVQVAAGSISALPAKAGQVERIQFDAPIGPGVRGGPLLDARGRVIGVILGRARADFGSGVGLAVPVGALRRALDRPLITFAPPVVLEERAGEPVRFEARAVSILPAREPVELELVLGGRPGSPRRFPMTRSGEAYSVEAAVVPDAGPPAVRIEARYEDARIRGRVHDATFRIVRGTSGSARFVACGSGRARRPCSATGSRSTARSRASAGCPSRWAASRSRSTRPVPRRSPSRPPSRSPRSRAP